MAILNLPVTEYQFTDAVSDAISIDKGNPRFVLFDATSDSAYVSYPDIDQILAIDVKNRTVKAKIIVQSPDDVAINSTSRKLFCITRGKIAVVDISKNEVVEVIKPNYASSAIRLAVNEKRNLLYVTYSSGTIALYDCATNAKVHELAEGVKDGKGLAFDSLENKVYVVNARDNSVATYDGSSGALLREVKIEYGPDMPISSAHRLDGKAFLNSGRGLLYMVGSISEGDGTGGGGTGYYLFAVDLETGYLLNSRTLGSSVDDGLIAIDDKDDRVYLSWRTSILKLSGIGNKTIKEIKVLKTGFWKRILFHGGPIAYNPNGNKFYRPDGRLGLLSILEG